MEAKNFIEKFRGFTTATVYEAAGKLGDMAPGIRPMVAGIRMVGRAFTVKCFVGDAAAVAKAIDLAHPGDILVIDAGGTLRASPFGSTSALAAQMKGIVGCVTNGSIRDLDELIELGFPVFAAGNAVRGNVKLHPGWTDIPVSVGGVVVKTGDIVMGDSDGVLVVPAERAAEVYQQAVTQQEKEAEIEKRLRAGEPITKIFGIS